MIDLSDYKPIEISSIYDLCALSSKGYALVDNKWYKKGSVKAKMKQPNVTRVSADSATMLFKEAEEIKVHLTTLEDGMQKM